MKRHTAENPCPICGGHEKLPQGHGRRCWGFLGEDGQYAVCHREEFSGMIQQHPKTHGYHHRLAGPCQCGVTHGPAEAQGEVREIGEARRAELVATYDYTDALGNLLYQVLRYHPKTFKQRRPDGKGDFEWGLGEVERVPYRLPEVVEGVAAGDTIYLCYSDDTEVLTADGWKLFSGLDLEDRVANWWPGTKVVDYREPQAIQRFDYAGDMVHIAGRVWDLLVTPDHRVPARYRNCSWQVIAAQDVRSQHRIPVAGFSSGRVEVGHLVARIVAAIQADGCVEARGSKVSWNLKKSRKIDRLRDHLGSIGVDYSTHDYESTAGWLETRVSKIALAASLAYLDSTGCVFSRSMLMWPLATRVDFLLELGAWDGDYVGKRGVRYFTSIRENADLVQEMAAISGFHSTMRVDRRLGKNDSYVVNLVMLSRDEDLDRVVASDPELAEYDGPVWCCTVDSGFLIVRRNGRVCVSGNCEGEKDVEALRDAGVVATCNSGGSGNWPESAAKYFTQARVVVVRDRDEPGHEHARDLWRKLKDVVESIVIVEARQGKDASEHLEAGLTVSDFVRVWPIDRQADPVAWKQAMLRRSLDPGDPFQRFDFSKAISTSTPTWPHGLEPNEHLHSEVMKRLPNFRGVVILTGKASSGKSLLATGSGVQACLIGWHCIYLSSEMDERTLGRRIRSYCGGEPPAGFEVVQVGFGASLDSLVDLLVEKVDERRTLVVFDSVSSFVDQSLEDQGDAHGILPLKRLVMWAINSKRNTEGEVSFLLLSEANKEGETKGRYGDHKADLVLTLKADEEVRLLKEVTITKGWEYETGPLATFRVNPERGCLEEWRG